MLSSSHSCSPPVTHALFNTLMLFPTHSCSPQLTHALLKSLMLSSTHSCSPQLTHALLNSFMLSSTHSCSPQLTHALLNSLMLSSTHSSDSYLKRFDFFYSPYGEWVWMSDLFFNNWRGSEYLFLTSKGECTFSSTSKERGEKGRRRRYEK